jgi:hypothetical protein
MTRTSPTCSLCKLGFPRSPRCTFLERSSSRKHGPGCLYTCHRRTECTVFVLCLADSSPWDSPHIQCCLHQSRICRCSTGCKNSCLSSLGTFHLGTTCIRCCRSSSICLCRNHGSQKCCRPPCRGCTCRCCSSCSPPRSGSFDTCPLSISCSCPSRPHNSLRTRGSTHNTGWLRVISTHDYSSRWRKSDSRCDHQRRRRRRGRAAG